MKEKHAKKDEDKHIGRETHGKRNFVWVFFFFLTAERGKTGEKTDGKIYCFSFYLTAERSLRLHSLSLNKGTDNDVEQPVGLHLKIFFCQFCFSLKLSIENFFFLWPLPWPLFLCPPACTSLCWNYVMKGTLRIGKKREHIYWKTHLWRFDTTHIDRPHFGLPYPMLLIKLEASSLNVLQFFIWFRFRVIAALAGGGVQLVQG